MKRFIVVAMAVLGLVNVWAIEDEHTGRPVVCTTCQTAPAQQQVRHPAPQPPAGGPTLFNGPPGAPAQIGSATIVKTVSEELPPEIEKVHYFRKEMVPQQFSVQVPVEYTRQESYVVHQSVPVERTGTYSENRVVSIPVTGSYQVCVSDRCGNSRWESRSYTNYVQKSYEVDRTYNYTDYEIEKRVAHRNVTDVKYVPEQRTRWIETVATDSKDIIRKRIRTTYTVEQVSTSEVP